MLKCSDKIGDECCPATPLLKHTPSNSIMLQALVIWLIALCALRTFKRRRTRRARNLSKAHINSGFIKAVVQPRTNHFSLPQLKMLHIPSSPTENTADMSLSTPLRLACLLPLSWLCVCSSGLPSSLSRCAFGSAFISFISVLKFNSFSCQLVTYHSTTPRAISVPQRC